MGIPWGWCEWLFRWRLRIDGHAGAYALQAADDDLLVGLQWPRGCIAGAAHRIDHAQITLLWSEFGGEADRPVIRAEGEEVLVRLVGEQGRFRHQDRVRRFAERHPHPHEHTRRE